MADANRKIGFHGKIPSTGDFVTRRLPTPLVDSWDDWMQSCMAYSKETLGDRWSQTYMVGPVWRFFLQSGVIGADAWCGLMFPSVDRVGRYFPFAAFVQVDNDATAASLVLDQATWFDALEALALEVLQPSLTFDAWDGRLAARAGPNIPARPDAGEDITVPLKPPDLGSQLSVVVQQGDEAPTLIDWLAKAPGVSRALWWERFAPGQHLSIKITDALPAPSSFPAFLDEDWKRWGWAEKTYVAGA